MATVTFKGDPVHTVGNLPVVGSRAPGFNLTAGDLSTKTLDSYDDAYLVLSIFPSLDTGVCAAALRRFNQEAASLDKARVLSISADLPFAQGRFCSAEGIDKVDLLSVFRSPSFGEDYGILIADGPLAGLLARAVVVLDAERTVVHSELVPEIAQEPDYAAALAAVT